MGKRLVIAAVAALAVTVAAPAQQRQAELVTGGAIAALVLIGGLQALDGTVAVGTVDGLYAPEPRKDDHERPAAPQQADEEPVQPVPGARRTRFGPGVRLAGRSLARSAGR